MRRHPLEAREYRHDFADVHSTMFRGRTPRGDQVPARDDSQGIRSREVSDLPLSLLESVPAKVSWSNRPFRAEERHALRAQIASWAKLRSEIGVRVLGLPALGLIVGTPVGALFEEMDTIGVPLVYPRSVPLLINVLGVMFALVGLAVGLALSVRHTVRTLARNRALRADLDAGIARQFVLEDVSAIEADPDGHVLIQLEGSKVLFADLGLYDRTAVETDAVEITVAPLSRAIVAIAPRGTRPARVLVHETIRLGCQWKTAGVVRGDLRAITEVLSQIRREDIL